MIDGHGNDVNNCKTELKADFSSNINCFAPTDSICNFLNKKLRAAIVNYPQPQPRKLEARLADKIGIKNNEICVAAGATEAIYLIAQAFKGMKSAILQPSFSEYEDACKIHGHYVTNIRNILNLNLSDFNLCWICNPNNPTGQAIPADILKQIIEHNPNTVFVIDQSYEHFTLKPVLKSPEALNFSNVIILHSFTKRYAIPGLRLGYAVAREPLIKLLHRLRMPWSVNSLAIEAGMFLADDVVKPLPYLSQYLKTAKLLRKNLQSFTNTEVLPTDTHFMLCRLRKGNAAELKSFLISEYKLLIRDASNFNSLNNQCFRIAAQTQMMNDLLVSGIKNYLEKC